MHRAGRARAPDPRPYRTLIGTPRPRVGRPHPAGLAPRRAFDFSEL